MDNQFNTALSLIKQQAPLAQRYATNAVNTAYTQANNTIQTGKNVLPMIQQQVQRIVRPTVGPMISPVPPDRSTAPAIPTTWGKSPTIGSSPPQLYAQGPNIKQQGIDQPFQLKGLTSNAFRYGNLGYKNANDIIKTLQVTKDWGGNTINLYVTPNLTKKKLNDLDKVVEWAGKNNLYVSLNPTPGKINNDPKNYDDIDSPGYRDFMPLLADRYKDKTNIMYGVYAEPHGAGEEDLRNLANSVIPQIRSVNPNSLIIFSGANGRDTGFLQDKPLGYDNIMYDFHDYPFEDIKMDQETGGVPYGWNKDQSQWMEGKYPILQGEFGKYWGGDFSSPEDLSYIQQKIDEANRKNQGYFGYALDEPGSLGLLQSAGQPSMKGQIFKKNFIKKK